nr:Chain C, Marker peptide [Homo sapiens]5C0C_H Chain H, Marker peptide [Homo sapiens]5C0J_C Chain C, Marker peptide [Homo sapiens]
RQFGPDWIVA